MQRRCKRGVSTTVQYQDGSEMDFKSIEDSPQPKIGSRQVCALRAEGHRPTAADTTMLTCEPCGERWYGKKVK